MKSPREHEIVVCRQLLQSGMEFALVDQAAGLVDYYEGVDDPGISMSVSVQPLTSQLHL